MSISGLHVTMFAWLAGAAVGVVVAAQRAARACGCRRRRRGAGGASRSPALYALFAGWGVPSQRTLLMLAAAVALRGTGMRWPWPLVLLAAAAVVTVFDPWALLQPGFWLSFAAVGLLMAQRPAAARRLRAHGGAGRACAAMLRTQAIATLGLAPLSLVFFQQVSLVGFVANLVAIPWVTLVVTPLALAGVALPLLWQAAAAAMAALVGAAAVADVVAGGGVERARGAGVGRGGGPGRGAAGAAAAAVARCGCWPCRWRCRCCGRPWPIRCHGRFELVALDIGQGTAVLVRTQSKLLVYDTGPSYSREMPTPASASWCRCCARAASAQVDLLMLSHRDSDHVGGAASLHAALPIERWSSSLASRPSAAGAGPRAPTLRRRPALAVGRRGVRGAASASRRPRPRSQAERGVVRAARARRRRPQRAADRRHRGAAGGGAGLRAWAPRCAARAAGAAPWQPTSSTGAFLDAVRRRSRWCRRATATVSAIRRRRCWRATGRAASCWCAATVAVRGPGTMAYSSALATPRRRYWHWADEAVGAEVASPGEAGERRP